ncbi:MAG: peptidylprolyl isomerase [Desulfuromonadales bacterium]|jgi:peptidylprolyl isomerase|nr:peptidylprolyl isomerase [Desulfuromonadales bacterium]
MSESTNNKTAKVHYTGSLADGTVFDSSREREPFEFVLGADQVIGGFDAAVAAMAVGETKTVTIPVEEAYGPYHEELIHEIEQSQFAEGVIPEVGMQLQSDGGEGYPPMVATVTVVTDEKVTIDANHPLAGQDLTFEIELLELV